MAFNSFKNFNQFIQLVFAIAVAAFIAIKCPQYYSSRRLEEDSDSGDIPVLVFMFIGLAVGIIMMQLLSFFGESIPYTCLLFLLGGLFSFVNSDSSGTLNFL
jgi:hypothetical protein